MRRSYYSQSISRFLIEDEAKIFGKLSLAYGHDLRDLQKISWIEQIRLLKRALKGFRKGHVYFEFSIPRMGKRVDCIIIIRNLIFVMEFKVGEVSFPARATRQVYNYSIDLQNFHEGSHKEILVPVLVSTRGNLVKNEFSVHNRICDVIKANSDNLNEVLKKALASFNGRAISIAQWERSSYKPTPTIIEASQALVRGHKVEEISRNDAGAINLSVTAECITSIIEYSRRTKTKSICFLTGVPGAGKTLAGLHIANERRKARTDENAVFLTGNGPLVYVLREALIRDAVNQAEELGQSITKKSAEGSATSFIQNIHHFRDDNLKTRKPPSERVVVFDEAQRAWTKEQAVSFMKRKGKKFNSSEPTFLLKVMSRHKGACTIVCLVGGGQEINTGEAGISEWIKALKDQGNQWQIYYSGPIVSDSHYLSDESLTRWLTRMGQEKGDLHLAVSVRSFRSEKVAELIRFLLDGDFQTAKRIHNIIRKQYPIYITRDLATAKAWLREKRRGDERIGLLASSGAKRIRPLGIDVKNDIVSESWFLNPDGDVRSSQFLEVVATEFDIQGLEIDYACLIWDINLYYENGRWNYQQFEGSKWVEIQSDVYKGYLLNAYRVLLTRARQGMVICVPRGDGNDWTRPKRRYDGVFQYLRSCGFETI